MMKDAHVAMSSCHHEGRMLALSLMLPPAANTLVALTTSPQLYSNGPNIHKTRSSSIRRCSHSTRLVGQWACAAGQPVSEQASG